MFKERIFEPNDIIKRPKPAKYKDGFRMRLRIGCDLEKDGSSKYRYKSFYGETALAVVIKYDEYIKSKINSQQADKEYNELLTTSIEKWLSEKYGTYKNTSHDRNEEVYLHQVKPYVIGKKTRDITSADLKNILKINLLKGYSYSTIKKVYYLLNEFFRTRFNEGAISNNPMNTVKMFTTQFVLETQNELREKRRTAIEKSKNGEPLSAEEYELVNSSLRMEDKENVRIITQDEIFRMKNVIYNGYSLTWTTKNGKTARSPTFFLKQSKFILFMLYTGIRLGEAVGLKYSDIDFEQRIMRISENITTRKKRDKDGKAIGGVESVSGSPKTKTSKKPVFISEDAINILKEMRDEEKEEYASDYIVHNDGRPLYPSSLKKRFDNLLRQAGIEPTGIHSLRHSFSTYLYLVTHDTKLVKNQARHSRAELTMDTYVDLPPEYQSDLIKDFKI